MNIYRGRNTKEFYLASALYDSIEDLNFSAVTSLIQDKSADANIVLPKKGISPFHLAIGSENGDFALRVSNVILQHGGDPNVRSDEGLTPLHIAAAWGRHDIVKLLLNSGADPDVKDYSYLTATDYAYEEDHQDVATTIKEYINTDVRSFFDQRADRDGYNYSLDKILVNNGYAVGEYELVKPEPESHSMNLKVLPQTNPDEYVLNWCNTLDTQIPNDNPDDTSPKSSPTSDCYDMRSAPLCFRNVTVTRPKTYVLPIDSSAAVSYAPHPMKDFCKLSEVSRESGVVTLSDSVFDDEETSAPPSRKISTAKSKDTSSDYYTCTEVSESANALEQNVFEVGSTASSNRSLELNQALLHNDTDLSFVSVSEIYKYADPSEGVVLYEKRLLPPHKSNSIELDGTPNTSKSSKLSSLPRSFNYDTDSLRKELRRVGFEPGPITKSTKRVYLRKLYDIKKNPADYSPVETSDKKVFSNELQKTLRNADWSSDLTPYRILEETVSQQFASPDPSRKWREGVNKSSFTYLLLDPRVTQNLPCRADGLTEPEQWEAFLASIFYVGKGKRSRPYQHLYDAVALHSRGVTTTNSKKLQKILDIWADGRGVVCLHVFQNVIPAEAYTREAAMIGALKLENLENIRPGDFYGVAATWGGQQKRNLGVYLLHKAMKIFLQEGERQLSPSDID